MSAGPGWGWGQQVCLFASLALEGRSAASVSALSMGGFPGRGVEVPSTFLEALKLANF